MIASAFPAFIFSPIAPLILSAFSKIFSSVPYSFKSLQTDF